MVEIRLVTKDEMAAAVRLSDATFRDAEHASMGIAFPAAFSPALGQSYGAFAGGKLVSFVGLVPSVIQIGPARLNVYSVGSVCTDPSYRGQGLAGRILESVTRHAEKAGASLMLVSGDRSLYRRMHCYPFGRAEEYELDRDSADKLLSGNHANGCVLREFEPTDWLHLHALAADRDVRSEQSVTDLALLIQAEACASIYKLRHRVLVAEKDGQPVAFLVACVPAPSITAKSLPFAVEWGGDASAVAALMAAHVRDTGIERMTVRVPWQESGLQDCLHAVSKRNPIPNLGTIRVVDASRLFHQLKPHWLRRSFEAGMKLSIEEAGAEAVRIKLGTHSYTFDRESFIELLFQPGAAGRLLDERANSMLQGLFPVPLPYVGGLNFV